MNEARRNIYLIGMMGTGKSTVGKLVASRIKMDFIDSDSAIEERTGLSVSEIFPHMEKKNSGKWKKNSSVTGIH